MSNEQTGRLIDEVAAAIRNGTRRIYVSPDTVEQVATRIVGELQSKYTLTPIEDNQQEVTP